MNSFDLDRDIFNNNPTVSAPFLDMLLKNVKVFEKNKADSRLKIMFRGHSDAKFCFFSPRIFRKNDLQKEEEMVNDLKRTAPHEFATCSSQLECLVKMQHYGLPTRLLDVTFNPLVALYFACCNDQDKSGMVYTIVENIHLPDEPVINRNASLSTYTGSSSKELADFFHLESNLIKPDGTANKEFLKGFFGESYHAVVPPLNNVRIQRQKGAFLLFGLNIEEQSNPFQKEAFDINPPCRIKCNLINGVMIPSFLKKQILKDLDSMGINQAFLFPEFEHQASYIREKYSNS